MSDIISSLIIKLDELESDWVNGDGLTGIETIRSIRLEIAKLAEEERQ